MLPRAAELYREQLAQGLGGDPAASAKARVVLREMLGEIMLRRQKTAHCAGGLAAFPELRGGSAGS